MSITHKGISTYLRKDLLSRVASINLVGRRGTTPQMDQLQTICGNMGSTREDRLVAKSSGIRTSSTTKV